MNKCMEAGRKIIIEELIPKVQTDDVLIKAGEALTQTCMTCWKAQRMIACVQAYGTALVVAGENQGLFRWAKKFVK